MVKILLISLAFIFGLGALFFQLPKATSPEKIHRVLMHLRGLSNVVKRALKIIPNLPSRFRDPVIFIVAVVGTFVFVLLVAPHTPFPEWYMKIYFWAGEPLTEVILPGYDAKISEILWLGFLALVKNAMVVIVVLGSFYLALSLGNPLSRFKHWKQRHWAGNIGLGITYLVITPGFVTLSLYLIGALILVAIWIIIGAIPLGILWISAIALLYILYWFVFWIGINDYEAQLQRLGFLLAAIALVFGITAAFL